MRRLLQQAGPAILAVWLAGALFALTRLGGPLERLAYDLAAVFRLPQAVEDIVIVFLDERSHRDLDQPLDRIWDRQLHARLLERLSKDGARLVLYDILFDLESSDPEADRAFEAAIEAQGRVILGASVKAQKNVGLIERVVTPPIASFREAAYAWGLLWLEVDDDFTVRRMRAAVPDFEPLSATWLAATTVDPSLDDIPGLRERELWLNPVGPPGSIESISFSTALDPGGAPPGYFSDKLVLVGGKYAAGFSGDMRDNFRTPWSLRGHPFAPGAEMHANVLVNLLQRDWMTRAGSAFELAVLLLVAAAFTLAFSASEPRLAIALGLAGAAGLSVASIGFIWQAALFFNWLVPVAVQLPVALLVAVGQRYYLAARKQRRLRAAFAAYLSPDMASRIADSDVDLRLGGEMKDITVMFTDLKDFTTLSEASNPQEIVEILNTYFEETTRGILESHGTIVKYVGDAVFAIWGAPLEDPRQADNAVRAAREMIHATAQHKIFGHQLHTRVGINSGPCLVGNLGSSFRFDFTAIGDAVNLASRIEGLNKQLGTDVLIAEATRCQLREDAVLRRVGDFLLVGKEQAVSLFELLDAEQAPPYFERFEAALAAFGQRDFDRAREYFGEVLDASDGRDGPARFYLHVLHRFETEPPTAKAWAGEVRIGAK